MNTAVIHVHRGGPLVALVGNPNCGKTALFNLPDGQPAEGGQLCRRHRRAQGRGA
jgi:ABC-type taurine transport system ATPase subunit